MNDPKISYSNRLELLFKHISEREPSLHAFIKINEENTRYEAQLLDLLTEEEKATLPLFGFSCVVTDALHIKGFPTSFGSTLFLDAVQSANEREVDLLKNAGALILGKTALSEFGLFPETENTLSGLTLNPLNPTYSPGGGVAGNAVAIAADYAQAGLTIDYIGGMRLSASFCGVSSFLPTRGLMPTVREHLLPFSEMLFYRKGIIAKNCSDLAAMVDVLAQPDQDDPISCISPHENLSFEMKTPFKKNLKIGYCDSLGFISASKEVSKCLEDTAQELRNLGHKTEKVDLKISTDLLLHFENLYSVDRYLVIMKFLQEHQTNIGSLQATTRQWLHMGNRVTGVQYSLGISYIKFLENKIKEVFDNYDCLLLPVCPVPPYKIKEMPTIIEHPDIQPYIGLCGFLIPFNISGQPVLTLSKKGRTELPIGLQFVGSPYSEAQLLKLGEQLTSFR